MSGQGVAGSKGRRGLGSFRTFGGVDSRGLRFLFLVGGQVFGGQGLFWHTCYICAHARGSFCPDILRVYSLATVRSTQPEKDCCTVVRVLFCDYPLEVLVDILASPALTEKCSLCGVCSIANPKP